jgi:type IV pilus assembly protein PilC
MATTFAYVGTTRQGAVKKGEVLAKNRDDAIEQLRKQNVAVTSLQEKAEAWWKKIRLGSGITDKDIVVFTRQFATMIDAGLPLVQCLEILSTQSENKILAKAVSDVRGEVEGGATYADALRKQPKVFDELYVSMVQAGEMGGVLDTILTRLAKHIEKAMKLKSQIKGAMVYPASIMGVATVVVVVLMIWVVPMFAKMFTDFGGTLPGPTVLVIETSNFLQANIVYILIALGAAVYGVKRYYGSPKGRLVLDGFFLKLPVIGDLIRKAAVAKFSRTLGTLIASGVPIMDGLSIVSKLTGNKVVEEAILSARQSISEGKTVADPLSRGNVFPKMVTHMIAVGESTGALDVMLGKIADFYDDEVDQTVTAMTSLLEPMMMVIMGLVIGFIVLAMYLPVFKMASVVG